MESGYVKRERLELIDKPRTAIDLYSNIKYKSMEIQTVKNPELQQKRQQFRLNGKHIFLTYPQCAETREYMRDMILGKQMISKWRIEKYIVSQEEHKEGGLHIHAYIRLDRRMDILTNEFWDIPHKDTPEFYHGNYQVATRPKNVIDYVLKEDKTPCHNFTEEELLGPLKKSTRKEIATRILRGDKLQDVVADEPQLVFGYARLKNDLNTYMLDCKQPVTTDSIRGIWIVGPPGTGKSHRARHDYGSPFFVKPQNKWWDGYGGEEVVILDDFDCPALGHYLKIWADKWGCFGEVKGSTIPLLHKQFIVTSNYTINELWGKTESRAGDAAMVAAIERRFTEVFVYRLRMRTESGGEDEVE